MSRSELPALSPELAIVILNKILEELESSENMAKLDEAKFNVGNEMLKMLQFVFPIVVQIQMQVIKEFGYTENRDGIIKFSQMLRSLEREDTEIARLHDLIKAYYLPPMPISTKTESPADECVNSM